MKWPRNRFFRLPRLKGRVSGIRALYSKTIDRPRPGNAHIHANTHHLLLRRTIDIDHSQPIPTATRGHDPSNTSEHILLSAYSPLPSPVNVPSHPPSSTPLSLVTFPHHILLLPSSSSDTSHCPPQIPTSHSTFQPRLETVLRRQSSPSKFKCYTGNPKLPVPTSRRSRVLSLAPMYYTQKKQLHCESSSYMRYPGV